MRLAERVLAIFIAIAGLVVASPAAAEAAQNCTLTRTGDVYCSGAAAPVRIQVAGKVVQLAANGDSTCALTEPGDVYCWGADQPEASADEPGTGLSPFLLITIGLLSVAGGVALVMFTRPQGAASRAASRNFSAPSLSRSV